MYRSIDVYMYVHNILTPHPWMMHGRLDEVRRIQRGANDASPPKKRDGSPSKGGVSYEQGTPPPWRQHQGKWHLPKVDTF